MNMKTKVCFVCPAAASILYPELPPTHGGAEAQLSWFARELAKRDKFDVHFVIKGDPKRDGQTIDNLHIHFHDHGPGIGPKLRLQSLLRRIDADIYLQQAIGSLTKEMAFFCRWRKKPFVYWVGNDCDVNPGQDPVNHQPRGFQWGLRQASAIIVQTQWQSDQLKRNLDRTGNLIRNAMPATAHHEYTRDYILWLGRMASIKQPEVFVDLAERIPEHKFLMVGPAITAEGKDITAKLMSGMKSIDNLDYIPGVPLEETTALFERAKLFVLTSISEGYPNTIMQAMWAGTPIASLHFDPDGLIGRESLGVAPTNDIDRFAIAMRNLLDDSDRLTLAGLNSRRYAESFHNIKNNTDQFADVLIDTLRDFKSR